MTYINTSLKVPLLEAIDRITILMLKRERLAGEENRRAVENEYILYQNVLDSYRNDDGLDIKNEWFVRMKGINAALWDIEAQIREARKNDLTFEEVGSLAIKLRDKNNERNVIKDSISQELGIDFYTIPTHSAMVADINLTLPLPEAIDRITILMLKCERLPNDKNLVTIEKEYVFYLNVLDNYRHAGIAIKDEWIETMKDVNGRIWDIESAIRQGREGEFGLDEMGRRTLDLRELSKERVACKKMIADAIGLNFHEVKAEVT